VRIGGMDREGVLEAGFVLLAAGFVAGLGLLVGGRLAGQVQRRQRHTEAPPAAGSVPDERHQHLSTSPR